MRRSLAGAVAYLAIMTLWIYAVANRWDPDSGAWQLPVPVIVQLLAGLVIGRWWALLLPVIVVFVSIPAGNPPITADYVEPFPIWFGLAVAAPVAILLVALGVGARRIYDRRSSAARLTT
jgi:predicted membrane protein